MPYIITEIQIQETAQTASGSITSQHIDQITNTCTTEGYPQILQSRISFDIFKNNIIIYDRFYV